MSSVNNTLYFKQRKNRYQRDTGVDGRKILKRILRNQDGKVQTEFVSGQGPMAKSYLHDTKSSDSIKCGGFYGWLRNSLLLKKYMFLEIIYFLGLIYIENSTQNLISVHSQRLASSASKREHIKHCLLHKAKRMWTCMRHGIVL